MYDIEQLLRKRVGLDVSVLGPNTLPRAIRLAMKPLGISDLTEYRRLLERSPARWTELVESLLVAETWFFREPEALAALVKLVREEWLPAHPQGTLRLLSVPCATGEEPCSMAIALAEAGIPRERLRLDAVDLSARALAQARSGLYGRHAFRDATLNLQARYFQRSGNQFLLAPTIHSQVQFFQANLLDPDFPAACGPYDFIFCRNLLIYLQSEAQQRALQKLRKLLTPGGVLFVGPAEQLLALDHGFVWAKIPKAFACRSARSNQSPCRALSPSPLTKGWSDPGRGKDRAFSAAAPSPSGSSPTRVQIGDCRGSTGRARRVNTLKLASHLPSATGYLQPADLEQARRLVDAGQLDAAAAICQAHLERRRGSAHAYYLLGLVREAGGDVSAIDCYKKALYLQPDHYETLLQVALLARKSGDAEAARNFQRRAQRAGGAG